MHSEWVVDKTDATVIHGVIADTLIKWKGAFKKQFEDELDIEVGPDEFNKYKKEFKDEFKQASLKLKRNVCSKLQASQIDRLKAFATRKLDIVKGFYVEWRFLSAMRRLPRLAKRVEDVVEIVRKEMGEVVETAFDVGGGLFVVVIPPETIEQYWQTVQQRMGASLAQHELALEAEFGLEMELMKVTRSYCSGISYCIQFLL
jgi:hypothetical protein